MLLLPTTIVPSSAIELARLLNEGLQRIFVTESEAVTVRERSYPHLDLISISLDGARLRPNPPRPPVVSDEASAALEVNQLTLTASPLYLGPAVVNLSLSAHEVRLGRGKDPDGQVVLSLDSAAEGKIEFSIAQTDLEALIIELAGIQARKQGIMIDDVQLKLRQENERSFAAEVHFRARKLFLSASIRVTGRLDLDDQLNFKVSELNCTGGGGAIASLACGILTPYLQKIDGREFPLMLLRVGRVHLRNVRLSVGDNLTITAEFGSVA